MFILANYDVFVYVRQRVWTALCSSNHQLNKWLDKGRGEGSWLSMGGGMGLSIRIEFSIEKMCICTVLCIILTYVTESGKTGLIRTSTEIHFLSVRENSTYALPRNTKHLTIDFQVCFYRQLCTNAVKP